MKKILLSILTTTACITLIACGSDSGSNATGPSAPPAAGNTTAILQQNECDRILQALPVQPPLAYTTVYDAEDEECIVTMPDALDASVVLGYFTQLSDNSKESSISTYNTSTYLEYLDGFGLNFHSKQDPTTFIMEFYKDCFNAAHVADIPEKDSTWISDEHSCTALNTNATRPSNKKSISMTEQQVRERIQELPLAGWIATTGCDDRLDIFGSEYYCFQKQVGEYLFELGYGVGTSEMLRSVDIAFNYQKIP